MEKRKAYYVSRKNVLTWLSVLLVLCSAVARPVLHCEKGTTGSAMALQILLPCFAGILFALIVIFNHKERLYRTAIPVALLCISEMCAASAFGLWHRLLVWLACFLFACYFWEVISGKHARFGNRLFLGLMILFLLFLRIVPENYMILQYRTVAQWLHDAPTLAWLTGILLLVPALRAHQDGKYHPYWGDRCDGRRVHGIDPVTYISAYIMPVRNGASNSFRESLDITDTDKYIRKKRREGMTHLTITQVFLAAYCRTIARYPALNRFLSGQHVYSRGDDIIFNMVVKKEMSTKAGDTSIKLHLKPSETLAEISEQFDTAVRTAKNETGGGFDNIVGLLKLIPGLLLRVVVGILKFMDYFGLLPGFLLEVSPFHGTVFFTSMASLGIPAIYHHLYDFGNLPVFCCIGGKYRRTVLCDDGTMEERKFMDLTVVCDERICDGFYYATAMKYFKRLISHPELLEVPPEVVNEDVD